MKKKIFNILILILALITLVIILVGCAEINEEDRYNNIYKVIESKTVEKKGMYLTKVSQHGNYISLYTKDSYVKGDKVSLRISPTEHIIEDRQIETQDEFYY